MIELIKTDLVRGVCLAYHYWWDRRLNCICGPDTGQWPNNGQVVAGVFEPLYCYAHEWLARSKQLQETVVARGLSIPLPRPFGKRELVSEINGKLDNSVPMGNPLQLKLEPIRLRGQAGAKAATAIHWLASQGHIVFYLDHTAYLNLAYSQREQEVEDVINYAPVLVYLHNRDGRQNGRSMRLVQGRQRGLTFIGEE